MIRFRYRDTGSTIHRLNPFCMIAWLIGVLVLALILDHPLFLTALFLSTLPLVARANIWREWFSFMRFTPYLVLAIIVLNALLSYNGETVLWEAGFQLPVLGQPRITLEAIVYGIGMSLRLVAIISAFAVLTLTVHPDDLMLSMIRMKLPYKSVLVTSLSTRFMPTLINDAERITDVQRSRGLQLDTGRIHRRIKNRISILIPLLSNSLDRTIQVAEAMDSRAFGGGTGRTYYKQIGFPSIDIVCLILALSPLAFGIFVCISGHGSYQYYPTLGSINLDAVGWYYLLILSILLCSLVPLAQLKRSLELD